MSESPHVSPDPPTTTARGKGTTGTTVIDACELRPPALAVTVTVPVPNAVTVPFMTMAFVESELDQVTAGYLWLPVASVARATSCVVRPMMTLVADGVMESWATAGCGTTRSLAVALLPPLDAVTNTVPGDCASAETPSDACCATCAIEPSEVDHTTCRLTRLPCRSVRTSENVA